MSLMEPRARDERRARLGALHARIVATFGARKLAGDAEAAAILDRYEALQRQGEGAWQALFLAEREAHRAKALKLLATAEERRAMAEMPPHDDPETCPWIALTGVPCPKCDLPF